MKIVVLILRLRLGLVSRALNFIFHGGHKESESARSERGKAGLENRSFPHTGTAPEDHHHLSAERLRCITPTPQC